MNESPKRGLLAAYGRLLGPLIRILIRNGVQFHEFSEIAKKTYVEVALKDFGVGKMQSPESRQVALTGLTEVEVRQVNDYIRESSGKDVNTLDGIVRVLGAWHNDADFTGPYGVPVELKFGETDLNEPSFMKLAEKYFAEVSPQELLEELRSNELVIETEKGWYRVLARNYRTEGSAPDGLEHLARTFTDLVNTLDHNLQERDISKRILERQVYTEDGIKEEDLPRFLAYVNSKAAVLIDEIDNWLTKIEKPDKNSAKSITTGLGIFAYIEKDED
jgi:hypothetical protein